MSYVWVAAGSALGGMARYWCSGLIAHRIGETFPWGTIAVNVIGSFVIGIFAALAEPEGRIFISSTARQFLMIGLCGGFTTFSAFSVQTLALVREGDALRAGANVALSVIFCLVAVWVGYLMASSLNELRGI